MPKLIHMEHEGALYRGFAMGHPQERWSGKEKAWKPYAGGHKPVDWGSHVADDEAQEIMGVKPKKRKAA